MTAPFDPELSGFEATTVYLGSGAVIVIKSSGAPELFLFDRSLWREAKDPENV